MKEGTKLTLKIVIGVIIVMSIIGFFSYNETKKISEEFQSKADECYKLKECAAYSCLADLTSHINLQRNLLIKEQNCLLRNQVPISDGGRT